MSVKYKIENSKKNKNLIGDEVSVSKIKKPGGRGPKGPKPPRVTLNDVLKEMRDSFAKQGRQIAAIRKDIDHIVEANNLTR